MRGFTTLLFDDLDKLWKHYRDSKQNNVGKILSRMYKDRMRVFLGQETFIYEFTDSARRQNPQVHRIKKIIVHPNFNPRTSENDIALLPHPEINSPKLP